MAEYLHIAVYYGEIHVQLLGMAKYLYIAVHYGKILM
jgi:hypothetical protein